MTTCSWDKKKRLGQERTGKRTGSQDRKVNSRSGREGDQDRKRDRTSRRERDEGLEIKETETRIGKRPKK
jgi:hypothetical protein